MQYLVTINGRSRTVTIQRLGGLWQVAVDGRPRLVDVARLDAATVSLIIREDRSAGDEGPVAVSHEVSVTATDKPGELAVTLEGASVRALVEAEAEAEGLRRKRLVRADTLSEAIGPQRVAAPMPGKVVRVLVTPGQRVTARQGLAVVEAMKMENEVRSPKDGLVREVPAREGMSVEAGSVLVIVE